MELSSTPDMSLWRVRGHVHSTQSVQRPMVTYTFFVVYLAEQGPVRVSLFHKHRVFHVPSNFDPTDCITKVIMSGRKLAWTSHVAFFFISISVPTDS
jgi:hypothetical protein